LSHFYSYPLLKFKQTRFDTLGQSILERMDDISKKIEELDANIAELVEQSGIEVPSPQSIVYPTTSQKIPSSSPPPPPLSAKSATPKPSTSATSTSTVAPTATIISPNRRDPPEKLQRFEKRHTMAEI
jgi:hypothetical protein